MGIHGQAHDRNRAVREAASRSPGVAAGRIASTPRMTPPRWGAGLVAAIGLAAGVVLAATNPALAEPGATWNFERVGAAVGADGKPDPQAFSKLAPWPQTDGNILYSGCYPTPQIVPGNGQDRCFMTVDLSDPKTPRQLARVMAFESPAGPPRSHIVWKRDYPFPNLPVKVPCRVDWADSEIAAGTKAPECWDPGWNTHTHYVARGPGGLLAVVQERHRYGTSRQENYHGVKFYDVSDPAHPRFLSYWATPTSAPDPKTGVYKDMQGSHHFNFDGPYLYLGAYYKGYVGRILVVLDLTDPSNPREVGHWALPGQKTPEEDAIRDWEQSNDWSLPVVKLPSGKLRKHVGMHYVTVYGDRAYLSYHQAGLVIVDVSDRAHPKLLSRTDYLVPGAEPDGPNVRACEASAGGQPAACGNTHSARIVPGRDNLLVVTDEYFACPYGHMRLFDVADPRQPKVLSHFLLPENTACSASEPTKSADAARYPQRGPSTHLGNAWNKDLYFMAWYGGGLRAIDISDPLHPKEAGRYEYKIDDDFGTQGHAGADLYDVVFGPDDLLYLSDGSAGLRVVRYTGPGRKGAPRR